jgi:hypothetical protein
VTTLHQLLQVRVPYLPPEVFIPMALSDISSSSKCSCKELLF